jgi:hypothetical protein
LVKSARPSRPLRIDPLAPRPANSEATGLAPPDSPVLTSALPSTMPPSAKAMMESLKGRHSPSARRIAYFVVWLVIGGIVAAAALYVFAGRAQ